MQPALQNGRPGFMIEDVRRLMAQDRPGAEVQCGRPIIGPLITRLRRLAWRALGLEHAFIAKHRHLGVTLSRLEMLRLAADWHFRPGTIDREVFDGVVLENEYGLPEVFQPWDIILDVGMHIGTFCFAAVLRGSYCVHGFEPDPGNFELACANLRGCGARVRLHRQAVWRSDRSGDALFHEGYNQANTGAGSVLWTTTGQRVDVVAFDDVIREVSEGGRRRVRLVKLDCEGAEYPILLTSRTLHLIDEICGEYHEVDDSPVSRVEGVERFTADALVRCLEEAGFTVWARRSGNTHVGQFRATRPRARDVQSSSR